MVRAFIMERVHPSDNNEVEMDRILSMVTMRIACLKDAAPDIRIGMLLHGWITLAPTFFKGKP